nr:ATP-binding protein [uncultured Undibacterium sp.]
MAVSSNETLSIGQNTDKNLPRLFGLGGLVVASVLVAFIALTMYRFNSFQKVWVAHSEEATHINEAVASFNRSMGYGGLIHNFKNLVLRGDLDRYRDVIEGNLFDLKNELAHLGALLKTNEDLDDLAVIRDAVTTYEEKSVLVFEMVEQARSPVEIDAIVKVNDTPALEAMGRLIARLEPRAAAVKAEAQRIQVDAKRDLWIGGAFLLGMVALVTALLNHFTRRLADQVERNQSILDNAVDAIFTFDSGGIVQSFNLAACRIFSYAADDIVGHNMTMFIPDFDLDHYTDSAAKNSETEGLRKDGSTIPIDLAISRGTEHNNIIYIGIARDISERRRLDRLKSEFVSTVSHELRTPLTSIHGSLKLLEGGVAGVMAPPALKLVSLAQKNSQRLILLINDLLDMEKFNAGKMTLTLMPIDLVSIVKQSILDNGGYGLTFDVQYVLAQSPDQLLVLADAGRLPQVLANLLSNAAKFSAQSHQVDIRVIIEAQSGAHVARVEIEDHGEGIPEDFQHEIFGAFAQANTGNTRKQGGTGLGLKISKSLINAMHGDIGFTTLKGSGTTFWFSLPLVQAVTQDIESTQYGVKPNI